MQRMHYAQQFSAGYSDITQDDRGIQQVPKNESSSNSESGKSAVNVPPPPVTPIGPRSWLDRIVLILATGFGTGLSPWAPGTVGSLPGLLLVWGSSRLFPLPGLLLIGVLCIAAGPPICTRAAKLLGTHDPGAVVYDEIAAFWIVFLPQLVMGQELTGPVLGAGFVLIRVFDISKLWPVSRLEKLPDGTGIMADDLAAGAMAAICLTTGIAVTAAF